MDRAQVAMFYRECDRHLVHDLVAQEAMPGHYLQRTHSRRFAGSDTPVRAAFGSFSFAEGWAVYAEQSMTAQGTQATATRASRAQFCQTHGPGGDAVGFGEAGLGPPGPSVSGPGP
jgi:hypothetical protein